MRLTRNDLLQISHVEAIGFEPPMVFTGVSTDSRTTTHGDLFIPLRGERFDGHNFLTKAIGLGATAILVEKRWSEMNADFLRTLNVPKLVVEDCMKSLGELARHYRRQFRLPILAVAGSNGKTTTKDMIASVLGAHVSILATEGNLNNQIGVPQTIFRLEKKHKAAVIEIGTNHPGEIASLCGILEPTHGIITNVGHEHLEFFGSLEGVAKAEGELFDWLRAHRQNDGIAFVNKDDPALARKGSRMKRARTFGFKAPGAQVKGINLTLDEFACARFDVKAGAKRAFTVGLGVPGIHNARNALAAAAVGLAFKVPPAKIQKSLANFSATNRRTEVLRVDGITVINDTYNANPDSMLSALETLNAMKSTGKKIAVLADMLELGSQAEEEHRGIGKAVKNAGVEYLLTFGPLSKLTNEKAEVGFKAHYDQKNVLSEYLAELLAAGDVVLIKGSRGMKMEDIVTFLKERFSKAA